jgi:hypothetical protein
MMLVALSAAAVPCAGQGFTITMAETSLAMPLGTEGVFNGTMTNTSAEPLTLVLIRTVNHLPAGWTSALCFEACYPPTVDTIMTTPEWGSSPLQPGESRSFSLHVYPLDIHGIGVVRVLVYNARQPADSIGVLLRLTSVSTSVGGEEERSAPGALRCTVYPNPFNGSAMVEVDIAERTDVRVAIVDVSGRCVALLMEGVQDAGRVAIRVDGAGLASGVYFCRISAGAMTGVRRLVHLK